MRNKKLKHLSPRGQGPKHKSTDHWLYGTHAVSAVLGNPKRQLIKAICTPKTEALLSTLIQSAKHPLQKDCVTIDVFKDLFGPGAVHQEIAVLTKPLNHPDFSSWLKGIRNNTSSVVLILDSITDPQNVGAIIRSAVAFGVDGLIVHKHNAPQETATMVKVASGGYEHIPILSVPNISDALKVLKEEGYWTYGMTEHTDSLLSTVALDQKCVFVMGAEGTGMRPLVAKNCDVLAKLPTRPPILSLNVGQATTLCLYEYVRQHPIV